MSLSATCSLSGLKLLLMVVGFDRYLVKKFEWVDGAAVIADTEVQVLAGYMAGSASNGNGHSFAHLPVTGQQE